VLITFSGQKVKGQGHSMQWPENIVNTISQKTTNGILIRSILVTDVSAIINVLIKFWGQMVKRKVTAGNDPKTLCTPYLTNQ